MALVPRTRKNWNREWTDSGDGQAAPQPLPDAAAERRADAALVQDSDALYARYGKQIFNTLYQWIGDYEEAADLTQETFISAHKARDQFRGEARVYTWLYRIERIKSGWRCTNAASIAFRVAWGPSSARTSAISVSNASCA